VARKSKGGYKRQPTPDLPSAIPCTYCGLPADTEDHIVPMSLLARIEGLSTDVRAEILAELPMLIRVYACRQCNSVLGNRVYRGIVDRRDAVKDYLRRKHKRLLKSPDWTDEEIDQLGYTLRDHVKNRMELKKVVKARLSWRR
jgi:5-methylcytosine-specific restriction endonuclease McrA